VPGRLACLTTRALYWTDDHTIVYRTQRASGVMLPATRAMLDVSVICCWEPAVAARPRAELRCERSP